MDIVIIGGGIVGLTMANLLAKIPQLSIAVIDPKPPCLQWDDSYYDLRCSALSNASKNVLQSIGVWQQIIAERIGFYDQMLVWHGEHPSPVCFAATEINAAVLGYICENRLLHKFLYLKLLENKNIKMISLKPRVLEIHTDFNRLYFDDHCIDAKLLIAADGANSWLRAAAKIQTISWEHQQAALVATVVTKDPHNNVAKQWFRKEGPLAFLPLDKPNLCSIVCSAGPAYIKELMTLDAREFAVRLGISHLYGERASIPLHMLHAKTYISSRIALIGDSAHVLHPLAGQGLNLGILDAAALFEIISLAVEKKKDIGDHLILRKYERWRKGHNLSMLAVVEGFKRFGNSLENLQPSLINRLGLAKNLIMKFAMGALGDIPSSAKEQYIIY